VQGYSLLSFLFISMMPGVKKYLKIYVNVHLHMQGFYWGMDNKK